MLTYTQKPCPQRNAVLLNTPPPPPPSSVYMHQWIGSALVQIVACRLYGANPISRPMLDYCQLDWEQVSVKFESEFYNFHSQKMHLKLSSAKMAAILSRGRWVNLMQFHSGLPCRHLSQWIVTQVSGASRGDRWRKFISQTRSSVTTSTPYFAIPRLLIVLGHFLHTCFR